VPNATKIFLNGSWVGIHSSAHQLVNHLKDMRRNGTLEPEIAVIDDIQDREVHVWTDSGRCCRPLFVVENRRLKITMDHVVQLIGSQMTFTDLVSLGIIEYIDVEEEETCMIAMFPHGSVNLPIAPLYRNENTQLYCLVQIWKPQEHRAISQSRRTLTARFTRR
jgi:DNA-directed RNA polymerase II subunit RPB2